VPCAGDHGGTEGVQQCGGVVGELGVVYGPGAKAESFAPDIDDRGRIIGIDR
jgi:hypothetical protein